MALLKSMSTSLPLVRRVNSSSKERNAFGGCRLRGVREQLSGQSLSEQRLSEQCHRLRPGRVLPLPHAFKKTGRGAAGRQTLYAVIVKHAVSG